MARRTEAYDESKGKPRKRKSPTREDRKDDDSATSYSRWWTEERGKDCAGELWAWIDALRPIWTAEAIEDLVHEAIYHDRPLGVGWDPGGNPQNRWRKTAPANLNLAKQKVDASTARLTKRRPMPMISADDAGWSEKQFAKKCSRVIRRKMGGHHIERISPLLIRDFHIRGTSAAKSVRWNIGDVRMERQPIYEFVWDPDEAADGTPQTLAHVKPINRELLIAMYPQFKSQIVKAQPFMRANPWSTYVYRGLGRTDRVEIAESWHLPSSPDCDDGQHVIAIHGNVLLREPWTRPRFPVAFAHWCPPQRGIRGTGLVEELAGIQGKCNEIMRDIEDMIAYQGKLKIFVQRGSSLIKNHLRARGVAVIEIDGNTPPTQNALPALQDALNVLNMLMQKADDLSGFNQLALAGKNILGSNASGKAIDTLDDIQSDRFAHVESGWMQTRVEWAQLQIDEARCMWDEATGKYEKRFAEQPEPIEKKKLAPWIAEVDWRKIDIDAGDYHLTIEPVNFLADSRAGRLSQITELGKSGLLPDPTLTADLMDEPDLQRANRHILGPKHNIDRCMEGLADPTCPYIEVAPDINMNLSLAKLIAIGELNDAQANGAPDAVLDRYRDWIEDIKRLEKLRAQGEQAPSLPGAQSKDIVAQPNAADLLGGGGGGPPALPPGPPGPPGAGGPDMGAGPMPPMPMGAAA